MLVQNSSCDGREGAGTEHFASYFDWEETSALAVREIPSESHQIGTLGRGNLPYTTMPILAGAVLQSSSSSQVGFEISYEDGS